MQYVYIVKKKIQNYSPLLRQQFKFKYLKAPVEALVKYLCNFLRPPEILHLYARINWTCNSFNSGYSRGI